MVIKTKCDAILVLEDGNAFCGFGFGYTGVAFGELVFNTAMTGYQETLTDPSYHKQIVIQTAPQIGNTGINDEDNESGRIWVAGYVIKQLSTVDSNWRSQGSLEDRFEKEEIVGIQGLDTRYLTRYLRDNGSKRAGVFTGIDLGDIVAGQMVKAPQELLNFVLEQPEMAGARLAPEVTTQAREFIFPGEVKGEFGVNSLHKDRKLRVASIDLGIKSMTPKMLASRGVEFVNLPLTATIEDIEILNPDGVFYSNGPGDPEAAGAEIDVLREVLHRKIPVFGICMGNQMLGKALGFGTYKLKFGHRGINQPVKDLQTGRVEITAHNHGFAVDVPIGELDEFSNATNPPIVESLYNDGELGRVQVSHIGLNDNVVEGIRCIDRPAFSVQYHPEAAAGPHDAAYLFDRFIEMMETNNSTDNSTN
ncbi:carbamoyl-phosphate synthase small chain [Actinomycetota bacterium]|nr:carbamoyl-phosphate synthase small chain [Actinomycetota bacterium]